jgi:toxin CcdB
MADFDVHATTGRNSRGTPYVVVVQSARFDQRLGRVVVPLVVPDSPQRLDTTLKPRFRIEGRTVYLNPLGILTVPIAALGRHVASLADDASNSAIINAIDAVITRAYG